jgi:hypothetical protein
MAPLFFDIADPLRRPDLARTLHIGVGVFLVLMGTAFVGTLLPVSAAALANRDKAAIRIWTAGKAMVGGILGSAGGVGVMLVLWGLVNLR